jgi:hypothetical protein
MPTVDLSAIQSPRAGYTPVRKATTFSTKNSGLLIWTRRCLLYSGATMIRELDDTILLISAGQLDNVTIDPLSDTRVLKGDSATPGAILSRFIANDGMGQECKYVAMKNQGLNAGDRPNEFLRFDNLLFDATNVVLTPAHVDVARGAPIVNPLPPAFAALKDSFLVFSLYINDLVETDFCSRLQLTPKLGATPVWDMRLPIPRLMIKRGDTVWQQLILGMELKSGVDGFELLFETAGVSPSVCCNVMAYGFETVCSYRIDQRSPNMKFLKFEDMLNNPSTSLAQEAKVRGFDPAIPPGGTSSLVRDAQPRRRK